MNYIKNNVKLFASDMGSIGKVLCKLWIFLVELVMYYLTKVQILITTMAYDVSRVKSNNRSYNSISLVFDLQSKTNHA